jgi:hypothetical protein
MPDKFHYGGDVAFANPVYILATLLAGVLVLVLRRDKAASVFVFAGLIIPLGQALTIAGAHFQMVRFLAFFGLLRIFKDRGNKDSTDRKWHPIDHAFFWLAIISFLATNLQFRNSGAFIYATGGIYTILASYFVARHLIQDEQDVICVAKSLVAVGVIASAVMVVEQIAHINIFGIFGGVPLYPAIREDRYRSQAMFAHSIIAGCYGATLFPLGIWLWAKGNPLKTYAIVSILCSLVMVVTSASSTPIMAINGAFLAFMFWPLRKQMRWVRRGFVLMLVILHMIMKAPVWQLIARVDVVGGNSADHRYQLVNQTIIHFSQWWMYGTVDNGDWGWDMWDTANAFVGTSIGSGLFGLICFIALFSRSFRAIGIARAGVDGDKKKEFEFWALGAIIFCQLMVFVGISYFDQTVLVWYVFLCFVMVLTAQTGLVPATEPTVVDRFRNLYSRTPAAQISPESSTTNRTTSLSKTR